MAYQKKDALADYVTVNERIEKFYQKYVNGMIHTEIVSWENGVVVFRAAVYRDKEDTTPSATGHAYEVEGATFINKTSALENCETSAVGRALALLGFEIKKSIASKEEVENAKEQQTRAASDSQLSALNDLLHKVMDVKGLDEITAYDTLKKRLKTNNELIDFTEHEALRGMAYLNEVIGHASNTPQE